MLEEFLFHLYSQLSQPVVMAVISISLSRKGLTLEELADLLVDLGAEYAINMDGGGSSTMVMPSNSTTLVTNANDNSTSTAVPMTIVAMT